MHHLILCTESNDKEVTARVLQMLEDLSDIPLDEESSMDARLAYDILRNPEMKD